MSGDRIRTRKLTEIVQLGYNVTSIASYPTPFAVTDDRQTYRLRQRETKRDRERERETETGGATYMASPSVGQSLLLTI